MKETKIFGQFNFKIEENFYLYLNKIFDVEKATEQAQLAKLELLNLLNKIQSICEGLKIPLETTARVNTTNLIKQKIDLIGSGVGKGNLVLLVEAVEKQIQLLQAIENQRHLDYSEWVKTLQRSPIGWDFKDRKIYSSYKEQRAIMELQKKSDFSCNHDKRRDSRRIKQC